MQVHWSGYDMTDYFKRPTELYILQLTRVIIQVFLYYPCLSSAGWLFFEADQAKLLSQHLSHTCSWDEIYLLDLMS
jgi:hypothetical protein